MIQTVEFVSNDRPRPVHLQRVLALGYTGRDPVKVQEHVDELSAMGITPPPHVPMLYPVMPTLVTTSPDVAVLGTDSTPEIEIAIVRIGSEDYLTVTSDQTDRHLEATSVAQSKNVCPKPVGRELWRVADVESHWDDLRLTARSGDTLLQDGTLAGLRPYRDLVAFAEAHAAVEPGTLLLSGTVPTLARPPKSGATIELTLHDPVRGRTLHHAYTVHVMHEFFT